MNVGLRQKRATLMYSKLYRTIFDGSLYGQFEAITVFMAMLALSDRHGDVDAAPAKIAGCLGCSTDFVLKGIASLEAPDPYSRTPAEEGRRIIPLTNDEGGRRPFGWKIVNYEKYRAIRNEEERRAYKRDWDRENRSAKVSEPTKSDHARPKTTHTDTDTDTDTDTVKKKRGRFTPPSLQEVTDYCKQRNNNIDPEQLIDFYQSKGWMVGKNKMKDWKAAIRTWERRNNEKGDTNAKNERNKSLSAPERVERAIKERDEKRQKSPAGGRTFDA